MTTSAPWSANNRAVAAPMPPPPPVTTATRSVSNPPASNSSTIRSRLPNSLFAGFGQHLASRSERGSGASRLADSGVAVTTKPQLNHRPRRHLRAGLRTLVGDNPAGASHIGRCVRVGVHSDQSLAGEHLADLDPSEPNDVRHQHFRCPTPLSGAGKAHGCQDILTCRSVFEMAAIVPTL